MFHITDINNLASIKDKGFIPTIGRLSSMCGEKKSAIYFFTDKDSVNNAMLNWFGENTEDIEKMVIFEVRIPDNQKSMSKIEYEHVFYKTIEPKHIINVYDEEWQLMPSG